VCSSDLLPRRHFIYLAAGAIALPLVNRMAAAQNYPSRPVRLILGAAPGGIIDILARLMGQWCTEYFGQSFVIDNRPGGGGAIAIETVAKAAADGYTLLMVGGMSAANATLFDKLNVNFRRDIVPVAGISRESFVLLVSLSVPARTVPEFIAFAKANPGKLNMASSGNGSASHLSGELFKMMTGIEMVHVPYRGGGPALTDIIAGQVQVYFGPLPAAIEYIRAGKLRALAVTTMARSHTIPELPTLNEFVPGYEASPVYGMGAPKETPADIIEKLNHAINAALADPRPKARLADLGGTLLGGTAADFGRLIGGETEKWASVIKFASVTAE
jgi:tripartite-type tricarboxylate transporter receptor subunit TctC